MVQPKYRKIEIGILRPDPVRGTTALDDPVVEELVDSFREVGILNAPIVRPRPKGRGRGYWYITGGRRIVAARKDRSCNTITCGVLKCGDEMAKEIFLRERLERVHLSQEGLADARLELAFAIDDRKTADKLAPSKAFHALNAPPGSVTAAHQQDGGFEARLSLLAADALKRGIITESEARELSVLTKEEQSQTVVGLMTVRIKRKGDGGGKGAAQAPGEGAGKKEIASVEEQAEHQHAHPAPASPAAGGRDALEEAKSDEPGKQAGLKSESSSRPQALSTPVKRAWKTYPVLPLKKSGPR
jgi:ParB-like chromosome segregation protein Spo0J